jgi:hypothetical protein
MSSSNSTKRRGMKWGLTNEDTEEIERMMREDLTSALKELPPVWEPWTFPDMIKLSSVELDRLHAWLKNKEAAIMDFYEIQVFKKQRRQQRLRP